MLHFQTTVIFKLESVNATFLRDLKQNLLKILRMKSTQEKTERIAHRRKRKYQPFLDLQHG